MNERMKNALNALYRDLRELAACVDTGQSEEASHAKKSKRGKRRGVAPSQLELPIDEKAASKSAFMTTTEAARYCRFVTSGGLRKAWYAKLVFPSGRRGGKNILIWQRGELDRFLRGELLKPKEAEKLLMPDERGERP